ncbi:retrovirus-related pol polyprotein from transposon TNT 1-94, partial [Tanacetum coccineum]
TKRPARLNDTMACASSIAADDVPTTYSEATWELTNLPERKKAIGCKWVYAKKEGFLGQDDVRYKERLNFVGFGSAVRFGTSSDGCEDCISTWCLEEEIYMVQPGLIQSLLDNAQCNDMLIASQSLDKIEKLKTRLKSEFEMKDLDEAKMILGMEIVRERKLRKLCLTQKQYLRRVLNRFRLNKQTKRVSTPLTSQFNISAAMSPKNYVERAYMEKVPYENAIGSLMYVMICITRKRTLARC